MSKMPVGNSLPFSNPNLRRRSSISPATWSLIHSSRSTPLAPLRQPPNTPTPLAALLRPLYAFLTLSRSVPELARATLRKARRTARGFSVPQGANILRPAKPLLWGVGDRQPVRQTLLVPQRQRLGLVVDLPLHRVHYLMVEVQRHEQHCRTHYLNWPALLVGRTLMSCRVAVQE